MTTTYPQVCPWTRVFWQDHRVYPHGSRPGTCPFYPEINVTLPTSTLTRGSPKRQDVLSPTVRIEQPNLSTCRGSYRDVSTPSRYWRCPPRSRIWPGRALDDTLSPKVRVYLIKGLTSPSTTSTRTWGTPTRYPTVDYSGRVGCTHTEGGTDVPPLSRGQ